MRHACVTVDLDGLDCYRTIHGRPPSGDVPDPAYILGVRRLLDLFEECCIRGTLFVIGRDVEAVEHAAILREAVDRGHELASHSFHHDYGLRNWSYEAMERDFQLADDALASLGVENVGFRTPGYNVDDVIISLAESRGYLYDSSVFACPPYWLAKAGIMAGMNLIGRPSGSSMTKPQNMLAPITPYRSGVPFWRRGDGIWQVPMCVVPGVRFPVIGTSLHLMGARGFGLAYPSIRRTYDRLLNLEFHAIDFMDFRDDGTHDLVDVQPDLRVPWSEKRALYLEVFGRVGQDYEFVPMREAVAAL